VREAFFFGRHAPILSGEICGALPESAVLAFVDVEFASHQFVLFGHSGNSSEKSSFV
jgi:hypothetical protein